MTVLPYGNPAPRTASARKVIRSALPGAAEPHGLAGRFAEALEEVLDPVLAITDGLAPYFDPTLTPSAMLELIGSWLGFEFDERLSTSLKRRALANAAALARLNGTRAGLALALDLYFHGLPLRVVDHGRVVVGAGTNDDSMATGVTVYCDTPISDTTAAEIERVIREFTPAHVAHQLRTKKPVAGGEADQ